MHRRSGSAVLTAAVRADNRDGDGFPLSLTMTATSMMAAMMVTPPLMVTLTPTLCPSPPPMPATITVTLTTMPLMLVMVVVQMSDRRAVPGAWSLGASLRDRATLPSPLRGLGPSGGYPSRLRSLRSLRADACPAARSAHRRVPHRRRRRYLRRYPPLQCRVGLALALRASPVALRASPVPASPRTGFRTAPGTGARTSADTSASAFGSVLRTTACGSVRTAAHSIAVAAPLRRLRRRRFPLRSPSDSWLFLRPAACGSHTRRIVDALPASVRHRMNWRKRP